MWINKPKNWNKSTTPLERFLAEKIIQRCDYNEILTNQHRTTNGFTQLSELLKLAKLSIQRGRTIRTVVVLIEEAKSYLFNQNIVNDLIINKYFIDIKNYFANYDETKLLTKESGADLIEINKLIYKLEIFLIQLEKGYLICLRKEFLSIDYKSSEKIFKSTKKITKLVDILIPFIVYKGYSVSSMMEIIVSWIEKNYHITAKRLFQSYYNKKRTLDFLIITNKETSEIELLPPFIRLNLGKNIEEGKVENLKKRFESLEEFSDDSNLILYSSESLDPHVHFRVLYDTLLKQIIQTSERRSLLPFNNFFSNCYWRVPKKGKKYHPVTLINDPININYRATTLRDTFTLCSKDYKFEFSSKDLIPIPNNVQLQSALYYYNLALGSKSIENSLSLLWTSLETLLPYRVFYSDIDCVQHFVSKSLALGSICRNIYGFQKRIVRIKNVNGIKFKEAELPQVDNKPLSSIVSAYFTWFTDMNNHEEKFRAIKSESELLAHEYAMIGIPLTQGKLGDLSIRIQSSNKSISYQLQRIYLHRNQIIHTGNLINEYTNLWMHLEWYVGKLLAYAIIKLEITQTKNSLVEVFRELEADYDYVTSYLDKNKDLSITQLSGRVKKIMLNYYWQSF